MKILRQPNRWSCFITSFAMILGVEIQELIDEIGHDGSEVFWEDMAEPENRRGFHIQELIDCSLRRGWLVTPIEPRPSLYVPGSQPKELDIDVETRMENHMKDRVGVLTGKTASGNRHAVAWVSPSIIDPGGKLMTLDEFSINMFYRLDYNIIQSQC